MPSFTHFLLLLSFFSLSLCFTSVAQTPPGQDSPRAKELITQVWHSSELKPDQKISKISEILDSLPSSQLIDETAFLAELEQNTDPMMREAGGEILKTLLKKRLLFLINAGETQTFREDELELEVQKQRIHFVIHQAMISSQFSQSFKRGWIEELVRDDLIELRPELVENIAHWQLLPSLKSEKEFVQKLFFHFEKSELWKLYSPQEQRLFILHLAEKLFLGRAEELYSSPGPPLLQDFLSQINPGLFSDEEIDSIKTGVILLDFSDRESESMGRPRGCFGLFKRIILRS